MKMLLTSLSSSLSKPSSLSTTMVLPLWIQTKQKCRVLLWRNMKYFNQCMYRQREIQRDVDSEMHIIEMGCETATYADLHTELQIYRSREINERWGGRD